MRLATIIDGHPTPAVVGPRGVAPVAELGDFADETMALLAHWPALQQAAEQAPETVWRPRESVTFTAPYRRPHKCPNQFPATARSRRRATALRCLCDVLR